MADTHNNEVATPRKNGGIAFICSLIFLTVLAAINFTVLPVLFDEESLPRWGLFLAGAVLGVGIASAYIKSYFAVFIHEWKHAILSGLVGNKPKGIRVRADSGHFQYAYYKHTEHMNALIAIAPYFLPLFTTIFFALSYPFTYPDSIKALFFVGFGYGADLSLGLRDVKPWQTDLTEIKGGYRVAVYYVVAINLVLFSYLAAWITAREEGIPFLLFGMLRALEKITGIETGM
jgi:hypothetical protein